MLQARAAGALLAVALVTAGCGLQGASPQAAPAPSPSPAAAAPPSPEPYTVAVVDMVSIFKAHKRWPELEAIGKKIQTIQVRLASPPPPPPLPQPADLEQELRKEGERIAATMREEMRALEAQARARLEAFANELRAEHEGKLAEKQRQLNTELQHAVEGKRDELQRELEKFELATMAEYRIPLLNLRLKADVVGITNEEEGKKLTAEVERLTSERDGKIRAKAEALNKTLDDFQKAKSADAESQFKTMVAAAEEDGNIRIKQKEAEERAGLEAAAREREEIVRKAVEERRRVLLGGTEKQAREAQERYQKQLQAEGTRLQAELQELHGQRLRLEDSVMAEIKIEIATLAARRKVDVVLMHAVATVNALDLTQDVIERIKRQ
jgi:Skp family chaperone for outer membrane proteins